MSRITHAVILAAGLGSRLDAPEGHKLLAQIGGRSLLDYHLEGFARLGVTRLVVVSGYKAADLQTAIEAFDSDLEIEVRVNSDFEKSNGLSVLTGDPGVPFWLTMGDHLFEPGFYDDLRAFPGEEALPAGALVVDQKISSIYDLPDATLLDTKSEQFNIGKEIPVYDLVDCGMFFVGRPFVDVLRRVADEKGDCSTSDAVRGLEARGEFMFWDIGDRLWQDVDTPGARDHAEALVAGWG